MLSAGMPSSAPTFASAAPLCTPEMCIRDRSQPEPAYSGWRTSGGKTYYYSQTTNKPVTGIQCIDNKLYYFCLLYTSRCV